MAVTNSGLQFLWLASGAFLSGGKLVSLKRLFTNPFIVGVFLVADFEVIVIGAGVSGLACAIELSKQEKTFKIFEASDSVGGRIKTDVVEGFRLDHGFQVYLTAYPDGRRLLDYEKLKFKKFKSGALIRFSGEFCRISDVIRHPGDLPGNLFSKAASVADKLKIASLRSEVGKLSIEQIAQSENVSTAERLKSFGFSDKIIGSFFRPFFGGVFLENELITSRRMFDFVFKMFAEGDVVLPELGMGAISEQLANSLPADSIEFNSRVEQVFENGIVLDSGQSMTAERVVVATDQNSARRFQGQNEAGSCGVTCLYFSANRSPINEPIIVLNGDEPGPINNLCVPTDVSKAYGPEDESLISISVLGDHDENQLRADVFEQARFWYGDQVKDWQHLRTYKIPEALPKQTINDLEPVEKAIQPANGVYYCGDYLNFGSTNGALHSGTKVGQLLAQ